MFKRIKDKIIHWCGGYTKEDLPFPPRCKIISTMYPIKQLEFSYKYFIGAPKELIEKEMGRSFAKAILDNKLYESKTINSTETPELLNTIYSIYIADPGSD